MNKAGIRPEDILSDSQNSTDFGGVTVRKGTVAAFLQNIELLENETTSEETKQSALAMLKQLAPSIIATGLSKHVTFHNAVATDILNQEKI